jgi:hypothetical protein
MQPKKHQTPKPELLEKTPKKSYNNKHVKNGKPQRKGEKHKSTRKQHSQVNNQEPLEITIVMPNIESIEKTPINKVKKAVKQPVKQTVETPNEISKVTKPHKVTSKKLAKNDSVKSDENLSKGESKPHEQKSTITENTAPKVESEKIVTKEIVNSIEKELPASGKKTKKSTKLKEKKSAKVSKKNAQSKQKKVEKETKKKVKDTATTPKEVVDKLTKQETINSIENPVKTVDKPKNKEAEEVKKPSWMH